MGKYSKLMVGGSGILLLAQLLIICDLDIELTSQIICQFCSHDMQMINIYIFINSLKPMVKITIFCLA